VGRPTHRYVVLTFACAVCCAQDFQQTWRGDTLTIRFRAGAVGNLAWQLDTLSGHSNTKPKDYQDLWRNDLAWTPEDSRQLEQWSALHGRYRGRKTENRRVPALYPPNYGRFYGTSVSRDYAFRIATLNAPDLSTVGKSYRKLSKPPIKAGVLPAFDYRFAFDNRDGSLNVLLDALPLSGRLQIRNRPTETTENGEPRAATREAS